MERQEIAMEEYARVVANIDLDALEHNVGVMRSRMRKGARLMAVVKADGYGHGAVVLAKDLEGLGLADCFGVATAEEAFVLRKAGVRLPILVIGYTFPYCYDKLAEYDIIPAVFKEETLEGLSVAAGRCGKSMKVHIKVDTGMSRIGIRPDDTGLEFIGRAFRTPHLEVEGIFTHFARADEKDKKEAYGQMERFLEFTEQIQRRYGRTIPVRHCSNSAGILEMEDANIDMVRAGIILYGLWPSEYIRREGVSLMPVLELKSHIIYIKELEAGTPVSYGGSYVAPGRIRVATVPVGYGDGYPRSLSNKGEVLIRGRRCPILGRVCMDQMMVDVTQAPDAREMDIVTLIGEDAGERITAEELGKLSGRFNYELVCDLGKRIPRAYYRGHRPVACKDYNEDFTYRVLDMDTF